MRTCANTRSRIALAAALLLALPPQVRAQQSISGGQPFINSLPGLPLLVTGGGTGATTAMGGRDNINAGLVQRSVLDFGAKCDVVNAASGSYTVAAGSTALTLTSGSFAFPAAAGAAVKKAVLPGHGTGGASLVTTIAPTSPTTATLGSASVPGTVNQFFISAATSNAGTGGTPAPGNTVTLTGGTLAVTGGANAVLTIKTTKVASATVAAGGAGGTNGTQTVYGTTGNGNRVIASVTVAGGAITAVLSITDGGHYTSNPTTPTAEPVAGSMPGVTVPAGAQLNLTMRPDLLQVTTPGLYTNGGVPANPVAMGSSSGSLTGATFTMVPAFNNGGFAYGTDDSAAVQVALNPTTWSTLQGAPQVGATVTVPGSNCGLASTVTVSGQSTRLVGTVPGKMIFQGTNNPQGSAFQWLGALGGTMFSWAPPNGSTAAAGMSNGIRNIAFECGTPNGSNQVYSVPLAAIGMNLLSQSNGDFGNLYFDSCSDKDIYISTIASGSGVQDAIQNYVHDIDFIHPLDWDGIGIYHTGTVIGNGDFTDFVRVHGIYKNRPLLYLAALDNSRVTAAHFGQRPGAGAGWYGLDIAGSIYGAGDVTPPQDSTAVFTNISSTSVMRGIESAAAPPTAILVYGFDSTNTVAKTVLQPGHGSIFWSDENGLSGGSNGGLVLYGGSDGILGPLAVFGESPSTAAAARAAAIASGGSASSYFYNTSSGNYLILDNGTARWGLKDTSGNLVINRLAGSGVLSISGNGGNTARIGDPGTSGYTALSLNAAGTFNLASANLFGDNGDSEFYINRPTGGGIHFRENNGADQASIAATTGLFTNLAQATTGTVLPTQAAGTLGIGGIASAPTLAANGEGDVYLSTAGGLLLQGQGSASDIYFINKGGTAVAGLLTGSNMWVAGLDWAGQSGGGNRMRAILDDTTGNLTVSSVGTGTVKAVQIGSGSGVPQHITSGQTTPPAVTTCNQGGGSPSIIGTDTVGEVTTGTLATSCVVTFNVAYVAAPHCTLTWQASLASTGYTVTNAAITFTQTATTGEKVNYHCFGRSGG